jgi:hypothetical protein
MEGFTYYLKFVRVDEKCVLGLVIDAHKTSKVEVERDKRWRLQLKDDHGDEIHYINQQHKVGS